ncbi:hypothetical protein K502DRAFT_313627 [Neoconidiobolus thromboides FSU 785]|nr:hypothetical protein K502DRAFT_313627 [Neoconidiobolus thromboides FSU 785]
MSGVLSLPLEETELEASLDSTSAGIKITNEDSVELPNIPASGEEENKVAEEDGRSKGGNLGGAGTSTKFTYYWITDEKDFTLGEEKAIPDCSTKGTLAKVSNEYWETVHLEGSGVLRDGQFINCGDQACDCFIKSEPIGSKGDPLEIYTSLANNDYPTGTLVHINEFDGLKLPNGKTHNGCFKVVDVSWSFGAGQIDLYVKDKAHYNTIQESFKGDYVTASFNASCKVEKYE